MINMNDTNYHVRIEGEGEPLLLLHGFTGSCVDWLPFVDKWKDRYQLILVDLMGHGKTDHPKDVDEYAMNKATEALNHILSELKIESAYVLGYSLGGRVALSFAMRYPKRVKKLILESSSPGLQTEEERLERKRRDDQLADRILRDGIESFVRFWESIPLFKTQLELLSEEDRNRLRTMRLRNSEVGLANSLRGMGTGVQPSWWAHLEQFEIPTTLIVGERDQKFLRIAEEMLKLIPYGNLVVIENAGHTVHLEQPEAFAHTVLQVLHKRKDD
ncbi:2-succinyl-6-hydroxy-2,4-cyclohexadiene-1-carboxylate synthase [Pseudalkalibacillus berkeleyi]|uniref:Putative 2-succinyl-6-hydroxy-2,4-cyclohexadiene-1-carboxylate synthase n=1 Tax=Pseudalkalibacillus berkeleyi TaxID=1069813 RepID=A0ABS9H062_9BACL|nr:2-succinyl-6-hydroxy-2,4-cyclohexadiene-1-carboxylate synthase [Pseudalkalibacillus berkeleyi]MCF6138392.1 2-succinyl-6-hydroxy-2,4-cyclohexadiene-1-carboxylate synthase [Pseudalkalibacillus berkeleyi]